MTILALTPGGSVVDLHENVTLAYLSDMMDKDN